VLLRFPNGDDVRARIARLVASGHFSSVTRISSHDAVRFNQSNSEPLAFSAGQSDPHVHQWALVATRVPDSLGAWHFTLGRAQVGSLDGGLQPGHVDTPGGAGSSFSNYRAHQSARLRDHDIGGSIYELFATGSTDGLNEIGSDRGYMRFVHHGQHVNSIMVAPRNGQGIAGVCPECTLQTFRFDNLPSIDPVSGTVTPGVPDPRRLGPLAVMIGRFGTTALNMSIDQVSQGAKSLPEALLTLANRDVVMVAAAGNRHQATVWVSPPQSVAAVIKVGATDRDNYLWDETRIAQLAANRRHPVKLIGDVGIVQGITGRITRRCSFGEGDQRVQCGSNYGTSPGVIDLVAPGAQVIGAMTTGGVGGSNASAYVPVPLDADNTVPAYGNVPDGGPIPPSRANLGVSSAGVQNLSASAPTHGPMTGTSMAAPHVTAAAGLMRSFNPLLSASEIRFALTDSADEAVPNYTAAQMGGGLLNVRGAMEQTAGLMRGNLRRNRLTPVFAAFAEATTLANEKAPGEEVVSSQPLDAWLYTTNAQLATAAMAGDIYWTWAYSGPSVPGPNQPPPPLGPTVPAAYLPSNLLSTNARRVGIPVPTSVYRLPTGAGGYRTPAASFYVFTTPQSPLAGVGLQPLYRLSTRYEGSCAGAQRKHLYTTSQDAAQVFIDNPVSCTAAVNDLAYRFESIEGYVYAREAPRPPGTLALFRGNNNALNVSALIVETEQWTSAYAGYSVDTTISTENPAFLGWVYPTFVPVAQPPSGTIAASTQAADRDADGLIDGLELVFGLNDQAANGDCDGANDAVEYGFAQLPSDPMSPTASCADARVSAIYNPAQQTVTVSLLNPHGPAALPTNTVVRIVFPVGPSPMSGGGPSLPPGCVIVPSLAIYSIVDCSPATSVAVGSQFDFVLPYAGSSPGSNTATVQSTPGWTDPANSLFASNNSVAF
jgi:hypothetical protein